MSNKVPQPRDKARKKIFATIPHSGEEVPDFCAWLKNLPEPILMQDVDRFVDQLYEPALNEFGIPFVKTKWHRYAADLNRIPEDIDASSVQGSENPAGAFSRGFHWVMTTKKEALLQTPMSKELHQKLTELIYNPFHQEVRDLCVATQISPNEEIYHLDLHSMPSLGTSEHRDPGEYRADIVVSDCKGKSSKKEFVDIVISSYARAGFKVAYNWPYFGGRVTEQYGHPAKGHHTVQVELNRALYMDEVSKKLLPDLAKKTSSKLKEALRLIDVSIA